MADEVFTKILSEMKAHSWSGNVKGTRGNNIEATHVDGDDLLIAALEAAAERLPADDKATIESIVEAWNRIDKRYG